LRPQKSRITKYSDRNIDPRYFPVTPRVSLQIVNTVDKSLIRAGDTVYIRCLAKANPLVHTITWYFQVSDLRFQGWGPKRN
jgi:hypothetical protein